MARYRTEGEAALKPGYRRPRSNPNTTPDMVVAAVMTERDRILATGHDAGQHTIAWRGVGGGRGHGLRLGSGRTRHPAAVLG